MSEIIRFEKVNKEFQDGNDKIEALKETSFSVNSGELVAIIGPSGSGKSTLLTMMGGLQKPTNGKIFFNGQDISELNEKDRNSLRFDKIGFILQASNLVPFLKISEQFELVDKFNKTKHNKEKAKSIMEKFGIYNRKDQYPGDLSGGERQRAAIARALYPEPNLILADEPTASLDTNRAMDVVKILKEITEDSNRTTIMVTHDNRL
ncbi:ABC transporter ATP-binding protein, partial [Helcococcus ovis]